MNKEVVEMKSYEMIENLQEKLNNTPVASINMNLYRELVFGLEDVQKQMISEKDQTIKALEEKASPLGIGFFPDSKYLKLEDAIEIIKAGD